MDGARTPLPAGLAEAADLYCAALHGAEVEALRELFAPQARLYGATDPQGLSRDDWLLRVAGRGPEHGEVGNAVEWLDATGPDTGLARVGVRIGGRGFLDYLNLLLVDGRWQVIAKVYRQSDPAP